MCTRCSRNQDTTVDPKLAKLKEFIQTYQKEAGALIPVLQEAQGIYGYLPEEIINLVSRELKKPVAEVFGVATFYSQFRFTPTGRNVIRVCMGTACHVRGALKVLKALERELGIKAGATTEDGRFTLETVACIGACGLAPVISVNNKVFGNMTAEKVSGVIEQYE